MNLRFFQKGFNYSQDGRGNRLVYHLQGCNMKCPWCANPEGISRAGTLMTDPDWLDESCCPKGAAGKGQLDRHRCDACPDKPCVSGRRQKGIRWSCEEQSVAQITDECIRSQPMFFDGGGVTLTGGEMSLQFEAVKELLIALGEAGIHRAVETNGTHPRVEELFPLVDEWIMDLKHWDDGKHRAWLGIGNERVLKTFRGVCRSHPDVLIRIPLMPGFNDSREDAIAFSGLVSRYANRKNVRMEVLTYHEFGKMKWARCGMEYTMQGGKISGEQRTFLEDCLRNAGIKVVRT